MNLICAKGLSPSAEADLSRCTATVDLWANHVRSETDRHLYRFQRNPAEFEYSEGFYRMLMLCVVLEEDYGIHYDTSRTNSPDSAQPDDRFFTDPEVVFLNGLLGPRRVGTCSSLPVLYVAIGRRLGYPLKLVATRGHLFVRWESSRERFNVEATGHGLCRFDDDYYRHWPFKISATEESENQYLRSLTPSQELAVFLSTRGMCLVDLGRSAEAAEAFAAATRLAPDCQEYSSVIARLKLRPQQPPKTSSAVPRARYQTAQK